MRKTVTLGVTTIFAFGLSFFAFAGDGGVIRDVEYVEDYGCAHWEDPGSQLEAGIEICTELSVMTTSQFMPSGIIKRTVYMYSVETMTYYEEFLQEVTNESISKGIGSLEKGVIASKVDREGCVVNEATGTGLLSIYKLHYANGKYVKFDLDVVSVDCDTYFSD